MAKHYYLPIGKEVKFKTRDGSILKGIIKEIRVHPFSHLEDLYIVKSNKDIHSIHYHNFVLDETKELEELAFDTKKLEELGFESFDIDKVICDNSKKLKLGISNFVKDGKVREGIVTDILFIMVSNPVEKDGITFIQTAGYLYYYINSFNEDTIIICHPTFKDKKWNLKKG